jgi:hypothetical protein
MDTDRDPDQDIYAIPVRNIVAHLGDRLFPIRLNDGRYEYRLYDTNRHHYATLVGHHDDDSHFIIDGIDYLGGELLPVRADPHSKPVTLTVADSRLVGTISASVHQYGDPYQLSLTHAHVHGHNHIPGGRITHDHAHVHAGDEFHRAGTFGHAADDHAHGHAHAEPAEPAEP